MSLPSNRPRRTAALLLLAALVAGTVAGCTATHRPSAEHPKNDGLGVQVPAHVEVTPVGAARTDWQLPIDHYQFTPDQEARLQSAVYTLANSCMKDLGFTSALPTRLNPAPAQNAFRYGPVTDGQASEGYRWLLTQAKPDAAGAADPGAAEYAALLGRTSSTPSGRPVPAGGCLGSAHRTLEAGGGVIDLPPVVRQIGDDTYALSQTAPQVRSVFQAWSACMKRRGYTYQAPTAPAQDTALVSVPPAGRGPIPPAGEREVAVARADVACKGEGDVVSVWSSVERAMQDDAIAKHADELQPVPRQIAQTMTNVAAVLDSPAGQAG